MSIPSVIVLTDYRGFFETKQKSKIYRGGMDLELLGQHFKTNGFEFQVHSFINLNYQDLLKTKPYILYTSAEDKYGYYKSFIEDIVFHLENVGLKTLPEYRYLKAHNNKVSMELLREESDFQAIKTIKSHCFGTLEELKSHLPGFNYPILIKSARGSMSRGVLKAESKEELVKNASKISRSFNCRHDLKDWLRKKKYKKFYIRESRYRMKFIVQNFIGDLRNDWKVLVYGNRCYILYRANRENDFRASGSGSFSFREDIPPGILNFAWKVREHFNVPHISLDIGYSNNTFHLLEFQFLLFGTTTIEKAPFFYEKTSSKWRLIHGSSILEEVYANSIMEHISKL